jgi:hypothetical protein
MRGTGGTLSLIWKSLGTVATRQLGATRSYIQFSQDGTVVSSTSLRGAACRVYREMLAEWTKQAK